MIFDTHAHYDDRAFAEDRDEIFARFPEVGIGRVVDIASNLESIDRVLSLTQKYDFMYGALGIHPSDCAPLTEELLNQIAEKLREPKILAVGEIGLDYYWDEPDRALQQHWFRRQIEMAQAAKKPIVVHSRDAAQDTYDIMKEMRADRTGGVVHCFSYGADMAKAFVKMGFYIGVGGVVTFKNGRKLKEVVQCIPLERIVLETDCPYLAPVPHRGERNSSLNLPYVVAEIAQLKEIDPEEVIETTEKNAERMYMMQ